VAKSRERNKGEIRKNKFFLCQMKRGIGNYGYTFFGKKQGANNNFNFLSQFFLIIFVDIL